MDINAAGGDLAEQAGRAGAPAKLLGTYPQRQKGLFMQRIPVFGGRIDWHRFKSIARIALKYAAGSPLHITTRQSIELHNVPSANADSILSELSAVGIDTFGAGGDSLRNFTLCSGCEFNAGGYDVWPAARLVSDFLLSTDLPLRMHRKFKVSFSGCQRACAKPYINDLGFVAKSERTFTVIGAGSLGREPATGIVLYPDLKSEDLLPLSLSALEMFVELGDSKNRRTARLRHVRQRLGDAEFCRQLNERFEANRKSREWPGLLLSKGQENIRRTAVLQLPFGDICPDSALLLAEAAQKKNAVLRINLDQGLEIYGPQELVLPAGLKELTVQPRIVSCPGKASCKYGLVDTHSCLSGISEAVSGMNCGEKTIAVSGCPNNCAQSAVADIGLVGCSGASDKSRRGALKVYAGGENGRTDKIAEFVKTVSVEDVGLHVKDMLQEA